MSETIKILLRAHLRYNNGGREEIDLPFRAGATIADYLKQLPVPTHEFMGVALDGELSGDLTRIPAAGSVLELIPAMSGG